MVYALKYTRITLLIDTVQQIRMSAIQQCFLVLQEALKRTTRVLQIFSIRQEIMN